LFSIQALSVDKPKATLESAMSLLSRTAVRLGATTLLLAGASQAHALSGWYFNPTGGGFADAAAMSAFDVGGYGFIEQSLSWSGIQFEEHGAYQWQPATTQAADITVTYEIAGTIGLGGTSFTSSLISLYSDTQFDFGSTNGIFGADNGQLIAQFEVDAGSLSLIPLGASLQASLVGGSMASGYFFDAQGNDLAGASGIGLELAVASQFIYPRGGNIVPEIACEYAGFTGYGCNGQRYWPSFVLAYATVQDAGVARLTYNEGVPVVAVPEPASALMMLAGLLGIGFMRRMRR
jgi:hypothetical protein